jgi:hypothetical protein
MIQKFNILRNEAGTGGDGGGGNGTQTATSGAAAVSSSDSGTQAADNAAQTAAATTGTQTAAAPPPDSQSNQQTPPPLVNPDGTFAPDFHTRPEFAEAKGIERFKSPADLAKAYRELEVKLSKGETLSPSAKPAADAAPEAVAAWRTANGIPADPKDYTLKPEKIPDGAVWNDEAAAHFAGVFHKLDLPASAAAGIVEAQLAYEADQARALETAYENKIAEGVAALKTEWGGETGYQAKVGEIKTLVGSLGYDITDPLIFGNPNVVGFLGKVVGSLSSDSIAKLPAVVAQGGGFRQPADEAKAIMTDASHPDHKRYLEGDVDTIRKVSRLSAGG